MTLPNNRALSPDELKDLAQRLSLAHQAEGARRFVLGVPLEVRDPEDIHELLTKLEPELKALCKAAGVDLIVMPVKDPA